MLNISSNQTKVHLPQSNSMHNSLLGNSTLDKVNVSCARCNKMFT